MHNTRISNFQLYYYYYYYYYYIWSEFKKKITRKRKRKCKEILGSIWKVFLKKKQNFKLKIEFNKLLMKKQVYFLEFAPKQVFSRIIFKVF